MNGAVLALASGLALLIALAAALPIAVGGNCKPPLRPQCWSGSLALGLFWDPAESELGREAGCARQDLTSGRWRDTMRIYKRGAPCLILAMTLTGCVGMKPYEPPYTGPDSCGALDYAGMIGTPIAAAAFPAGVRTIGPDAIVTQDHVPARLNVLVDGRGTITGFRCG